MNSSMGAIGVFFLLFFPVIIFAAAIQPFWALVDCVIARDIPSWKKIVGIIATLLSWSLGGLIYGSFLSAQKSLQKASRITLVLLLVFFVGLFTFGGTMLDMQKAGFEILINKAKTMQLDGVSEVQRTQVIASLQDLQSTMRGPWLTNFKHNDLLNHFQKVFRILTKDNRFTQAKFDQWMLFYGSWQQTDPTELQNKLKAFELKHIFDR